MHELPLEGISSPSLEVDKQHLHHPAGHVAELVATSDGRCASMISNVPSNFSTLRFCETWNDFILKTTGTYF